MSLKDKVEELERRVRELEQAPKYYPPVFQPPVQVNGLCLMCGGYHNGLQCPRMTPTCG